eukprot:4346488-Pyramimonas_sp.AAC.1
MTRQTASMSRQPASQVGIVLTGTCDSLSSWLFSGIHGAMNEPKSTCVRARTRERLHGASNCTTSKRSSCFGD